MKTNIWKKGLSLLLAVVLTGQLLPLRALAETGGEETAGEITDLGWDDSERDSGDDGMLPVLEDYDNAAEIYPQDVPSLTSDAVSGEITGLREETEKHFQLADGSCIAVDYGFPVHYETQAGAWAEIDNTMKLTASAEMGDWNAPGISAGKPVYSAVNGASANAFAAAYFAGQPLHIAGYGDSGIVFSLLDSQAGGEVVSRAPAGPAAAPEAEAPSEPYTASAEETPAASSAPEADFSFQGSEHDIREVPEAQVPSEPAATASPEATSPQPEATAPEPIATESAGFLDPTGPDTPEAESGSLEGPEETAPEETGVPAVVTNPDGTVLTGTGDGEAAEPAEYASPATSERSAGMGATAPDPITPSKIGSTVQYDQIRDGVSLQYMVTGYHVKESIVIEKPQSSYSFQFRMQLTNLTPDMQEDGSILFHNQDGDSVYEIPAPYMIDAGLNMSDQVSYTLRMVSETCYDLLVQADAAWINGEERSFPVVIDPSLIVSSRNNSNSIATGFTRSGLPNTAGNGSQLYLGYGSGTYNGTQVKQMKALLYFGNLPSIPTNCSVTGAGVQFRVMGNGYTSVGLPQIHAQLHEVTGDKPAGRTYAGWVKGITWNTMPAYSGTVEDYCAISSSSRGSYVSWNISRAVAKWYESGTEKRVLAMDVAESLSASRCAQVAFFTYGSYYFPYLIVQYRNQVGTEGYFTGQTVSAGRAGTGFIRDYTSQLILTNSIGSASSNTLPFDLALFYNSASRNEEFLNSDQAGIHTVHYSAMKAGAGWKLSVQESIVLKTVSTDPDELTYYIYNDADGTEHYFLKTGQSSPYTDDEGLGLSLTVSGSTYTLKDKKDNVREFYNGYLTKIGDADGNAVYILYNGGSYSASSTAWKPKSGTANYVSKIIRLNDGVSTPTTLFTLTYSGNRLASVSDTGGRKTTFSYSTVAGASRLSTVTYPDGAVARYAYDASTGALTKAYDGEAQVGVGFTYRNFRKTLCVQKVREFAASSITAAETVGNRWHLWVYSPYMKEYRFYGPDQTSDTGDDTVVRYTFDHTGKTVNVVQFNHDKSQVLGISTTSYTANSGTKTKNRVSGAAATGYVAANLLHNSGFEKTDDTSSFKWTLFRTTGTTGNAALKNVVTEYSANLMPRTGKYLLKTYVPKAQVSLSGGSCHAGMYQRVYLTQGVSYTFSAWANSSVVPYYGLDGGLLLQFQTTSGGKLAASEVLGDSTSTAVNDGWTRLEVSYTPASSGWYRVCAMQQNAYGYGAFDDMQLEVTKSDTSESGASTVNLVQMGTFELWNAGTPDRSLDPTWWTYTSSKACPITEGAKDGYSMHILSSLSGKRRAYQSVKIYGSSDSTYLLSGWAKATSAPNCASATDMAGDNSGNKRFFGIIAMVNYTDSSSPDYHYLTFDDNYTDWQYASCIITPKQSGKTVSTITLNLAYDFNVNDAYFDNISLVEEPVQTYSYDAEGNLKAATSTGNSDADYSYDGADLTKQVAGGYGTYTYEYDDAHNMTKATNDGVSVTATYDAAGNSTGTKLQKSSGTGVFLKTSSTQTADKDHTATVTDANGGKSTYGYNSLGQNLYLDTAATVNGSNTNVRTSYTYLPNSDRQSTSYISGHTVLYYSYHNGCLSDVSRKAVSGASTRWQRYHFSSDVWGNSTQVQVQGSSSSIDSAPSIPASAWSSGITLASYQYAGSNGYLSRMTHGNGDYETYTYDRYGRIATVSHFDATGEFSFGEVYVYDGNGNTARCTVVDASGNALAEYRYEYDSLGRLIRSTQLDGDSTLLRTEHLYDADNRLTKQSYQIGDRSFSESYAYSTADGSMQSMSTASGDSLSFSYDAIKRLSSMQAGSRYTKAYTYRTISGSQSSTQISALRYSGFSNAPTYHYTYTANGSIASQWENSNSPATFQYDTLGQLTEATLLTEDLTYFYSYDDAGNLLQVSVSGFAHGSDDYVNTYSYSNADWPDLLTAFNGQPIVYEGQTYALLTHIATGVSTVSNIRGSVRSGNPISYYNGVRWTFQWENGRRLSSAANSDTSLQFSYDLNGYRTAKTVNGVRHTYLYAGGKLLRETYSGNTLDFAYDAQGLPFSLTYNGTKYYYITNLQGDVMYLINSSGAKVASYTYDPYGKLTLSSGSMALINPLRYRSYYYDSETGFYYLHSRYYDPAICRFLNADTYASTGQGFMGFNMFSYCNNDPIKNLDQQGTFLGTLVGAIVGAAVGALDAAINGEDVLAGAASGAVSGAITGAAADIIAVTGGTGAVVILASAGASFAGSLAGSAVGSAVSGEKFNWKEAALDATWDATAGALFGYMSGPVPSQLDDVAKKGLGKVIYKTFCKDIGKKAATTAAEEVLSSAVSGVARLAVRSFSRAVMTLN